MTFSSSARHVVFAVAPELVLLDACGPVEAFWRAELAVRAASARQSPTPSPGEAHAYRVTVASLAGGVLPTFAGLPVVTERLDTIDPATLDTLIVPGIPIDDTTVPDPALVAWIAAAAPRARRVASVCTGAFYLAAAGLLDGRRATTHWRNAAQLARRYPQIDVDPEPIWLRDERDGRAVWTSAGVTAGIDLSLALIEEDYGHAVAMQAARRLVVFMKRPGGQAQFSETLEAQSAAGGAFEALHGWMAANLHVELSVERLAEEARMSPRTFARRYVEAVGRTPARTVAAMRIEAAAHALAQSRRPVKRIAADCGFGSEQNLRRAFERRYGVLPVDYRARFSAA
ncbi:MAG: helix-turn-helix domain-containing protein [Paraburkholderia tropica]|uniref:AraC family transcriptional regulator with amidase-like domain n=1 Tax=Paraburkholderia tropica TaxID=92647 RepID=A0ABX5MN69_9BURK|nr:helix-turn-helix domain-containing protein [Paraburkholderia tropica]MDE1143060.1 helix-turn-helix domain-containing protein [Paraburkholderia tropica]PXX13485.1 AraC family transcriptional regulator with amidase-like domain [Paraburkholderia tropica]PZW78416.1 AraC family transcriptional regulator with amidase-like domain [Paraburkholderia tropica]QNB11904.1 helix-turn-helix domain-containing protein [Paraburkholderia tropica]